MLLTTTEQTLELSVVEILQARLSDALDLSSQLRQAHWNVKGMHFQQLHQLFESINDATSEQVDMLGERIVTLGRVADGRIQTTARCSNLTEYPIEAWSGRDHVEAIAVALSRFATAVRSDIDLTTNLGDAVTADIFTGISRDVDKNLWFVRAHLEG